ncbi:Zn-ribbon domain-containing OB-fold protein [Sphingomonas solaris]|uniref:OB-fold domain-containing protein n=1 Tax=Alterirhizorhabdus solaris TaxID=2529389 RepID=A0A558RBC4_9SPHN|nr:OB-fold domain-containing protein [Sphingomonas solaris]TVV76653.1 OB-fold domain-containing protein [Sphingomonas solaris]
MTPPGIAPLVKGDPDAPFWEAWAAEERFLLHRCAICGRHDWPASCCVEHGLAAMTWVEASGGGVVDTYTVFHRAYTAGLASAVPYTVAVVRLDEGPYFHTRLVEVAPDAVCTGMRVRVRRGAGDAFPLFIPDRAF